MYTYCVCIYIYMYYTLYVYILSIYIYNTMLTYIYIPYYQTPPQLISLLRLFRQVLPGPESWMQS